MNVSIDEQVMQACINLGEKSVDAGEAPFSCIIAKDEKVIIESMNGVQAEHDIAAHAEIVAMRKAQQMLSTNDLSEYDIYSNCEPCAMCAIVMRELKFKRVIFSLPSPYTGGYTKWSILQDKKLQELAPFFNTPPEVIFNILPEEAIKAFKRAKMDKMFSQ